MAEDSALPKGDLTLDCPSCGAAATVRENVTIDADRRPWLSCPHCGVRDHLFPADREGFDRHRRRR